jgi:hypothetical protein
MFRYGYLYRLLRPEAVRSSPHPLSSDVFSRFMTDETEVEYHTSIAKDAFEHLKNVIIPTFAPTFELIVHHCIQLWDTHGMKPPFPPSTSLTATLF